ncbi:MAG TPA: hypothetical protein VMW52_09105 [Phycisphaerae bacterium]|nr:hypothetical protein [Phycisphaerae bacterium]
MAALLVSVAVMSILMSLAMPVWRHQGLREKEAELVFRGEQYARAVALYQRKLGPGSLPPSIDMLVEQKFLRKKYKDPMTEDGEFQILYASQQAGGQRGRGAGAGAGAPPPSAAAQPGVVGGVVGGVSPGQAQGGLRGGMIGVTSKSPETSIRVYNGATHYNEWQFLFTQFAAQPGMQGGEPGVQQPGMPGRGGQRGGQRGTGEGPGRGGQRGRGQFGPGRGPGGRGPGGAIGPGIVRPPGGRGPGG